MLIDIVCSLLTVIVIGFFKANIILKQDISILPCYLHIGQASTVKYSIRVSGSSCITEHTMGFNQRSTQGLYYLLENVPWMQIATFFPLSVGQFIVGTTSSSNCSERSRRER